MINFNFDLNIAWLPRHWKWKAGAELIFKGYWHTWLDLGPIGLGLTVDYS